MQKTFWSIFSLIIFLFLLTFFIGHSITASYDSSKEAGIMSYILGAGAVLSFLSFISLLFFKSSKKVTVILVCLLGVGILVAISLFII